MADGADHAALLATASPRDPAILAYSNACYEAMRLDNSELEIAIEDIKFVPAVWTRTMVSLPASFTRGASGRIS